ncbi:GtrA family protein [Nocardioides mangrovi]|uniref:GtrA family protein n=1 Tax=Nocardioides mangrovi TaxID=2874580 RepID=A0ABS7U8W9_9ACTN|nr:GtrA family protein [Nocardioides mangrovi]MBZ5737181.1 GtrA family protein [Nocardioides mangrovi]
MHGDRSGPSWRRLADREVATFLAVGGAGYITDVAAFNWLRDAALPGTHGPLAAKVGAVAIATVVTYLGNRLLTWRGRGSASRRREVALFAVFNVVGLLISVLTLALTHDVLGLTSRLADNLSGNVLGVGLGTAFRYWTYRRFVFVGGEPPAQPDHEQADPLLTR